MNIPSIIKVRQTHTWLNEYHKNAQKFSCLILGRCTGIGSGIAVQWMSATAVLFTSKWQKPIISNENTHIFSRILYAGNFEHLSSLNNVANILDLCWPEINEFSWISDTIHTSSNRLSL